MCDWYLVCYFGVRLIIWLDSYGDEGRYELSKFSQIGKHGDEDEDEDDEEYEVNEEETVN